MATPSAAAIAASHDFQAPLVDRDGIGGNSPPDPLTILRDEMAERVAPLLARRKEIEARLPNVPERIDDDVTAGKVADFIKVTNAAIKAAEGFRVTEKEPHLAASRAVDGFFKTELTEPLEKVKKALEPRLTDFQRRKVEEERRIRLAAEKAAQEAADRAAKDAAEAAAAMQTEADLPAAIAAEEQARVATTDAVQAAREAAAKPAELSRSRGEYGAVASLRETVVGEIVDRDKLDLERLRPYLPLDGLQKALNAFVKSGGRDLAGARIHVQTTSVVR